MRSQSTIGFRQPKKILFNNPKLMKEELVKILAGFPVPDWQKGMLLELMQQYEPALMDEQRPELQLMMQGLGDEVKAILPKAVREGHLKSLAKNPVSEPRADEYSELNWFVCETDPALILGDTGCLFEVIGKRRYKSIDDKGDDITNIFLPVATHKLLLGTSFSTIPQINVKSINKAMARCSYEYFICADASADKTKLISLIGDTALALLRILLDQKRHQTAYQTELCQMVGLRNRLPFGTILRDSEVVPSQY